MSRSALIICLSSAMPDRYQCLEAWTGFWWEQTQGYFSKSSRIWSVITMQLYGAAICQNTFLMTELSIDVIISWTSCNLRFFWLWLAALKCTTQNLILEFRAVAPLQTWNSGCDILLFDFFFFVSKNGSSLKSCHSYNRFQDFHSQKKYINKRDGDVRKMSKITHAA